MLPSRKIVEAAAAINPKIHIVAGGFHLVVALDESVAKAVTTLKNTFKVESIAPGHRTGEPTFAALRRAFGDQYLYAGLGTTLPLQQWSQHATRRRTRAAARRPDHLPQTGATGRPVPLRLDWDHFFAAPPTFATETETMTSIFTLYLRSGRQVGFALEHIEVDARVAVRS
jgi:hypothetical protein